MELKQLTSLVSEKLLTIGYELISLKTKREKGDLIVEVVVDRVAPIDMNAIVEVSNILNSYFDELDPFENAYTLDISSLGAEKPLKIERLSDYVGQRVNVHLVNPIQGENIFEGELMEVKNDSIIVSYLVMSRRKCVDITKSNISKIRLAIKF